MHGCRVEEEVGARVSSGRPRCGGWGERGPGGGAVGRLAALGRRGGRPRVGGGGARDNTGRRGAGGGGGSRGSG